MTGCVWVPPECYGEGTMWHGDNLFHNDKVPKAIKTPTNVICLEFDESVDTKLCATGTHLVCTPDTAFDEGEGNATPLWKIEPGMEICGVGKVTRMTQDFQTVYTLEEPHPIMRQISRFGYNKEVEFLSFPWKVIFSMEMEMFKLPLDLQRSAVDDCEFALMTTDDSNPRPPAGITRHLVNIMCQDQPMWITYMTFGNSTSLYGEINRAHPQKTAHGHDLTKMKTGVVDHWDHCMAGDQFSSCQV